MGKTTQGAARALKHARRTAWRKVADEAVILDVDTANYYSLSGTGLRVWELLEKGITPAALAERLGAEYEGGALESDLAELLALLRKERLVEPA